MKNLCFYFQVHQPYRLKKYRFFNIGKDHFYFDDYLNRIIIERIAENSYRPMNKLLLEAIEKYGNKIKVSFSITGTAIEQLQQYAPDVLESFKKLAKTGCVEFLAETYSHTLASLKNKEEFASQVQQHKKIIIETFGYTPTTFRNTELIYSDSIGDAVSELGYQTILTEGTKQILGWKSPNVLYSNPIKQRVKLLLRNFKLSDDISFGFGQDGMTADSYYASLTQEEGETINLFMDYETFGEHISAEKGIFQFMERLLTQVATNNDLQMSTPKEISSKCQSVSLLHVPHPISWADEERDITAWLGNELQDEAISKLYDLRDKVLAKNNASLTHVWNTLQTSDHFYYMCTKWFADGNVQNHFNPYDSPYDAFMNYMNVISDMQIEADK